MRYNPSASVTARAGTRHPDLDIPAFCRQPRYLRRISKRILRPNSSTNCLNV